MVPTEGANGGADVVHYACVCPYAQAACGKLKWTSASALVPTAGLTSRKPPRLFPPKAGSRRPQVQTITQPQVEEKDCEARPPHPSPLLRRKGGAIFSTPQRWMPRIRNEMRRCTWTCLPGLPDPFAHLTTLIQEMTRSNKLPFIHGENTR